MTKFIYLQFLVLISITAYAQTETGKPTLLPSKFIGDERFYLKLATDGDTLLAFCDTGGGFTAVYPDVIERLKLQTKVKEKEGVRYIEFSDLIKDKRIPLVVPNASGTGISIETPVFVVPGNEFMQGEGSFFLQKVPQDAFLGQFFFLNKAWTFDYLRKQVWVNTPLALDEIRNPEVQRLGFKKDNHGVKLFGHPSVSIEVDGEVIDVLFDTGATFILSDIGKKELGTDLSAVGGSFIAKSVFEKWRTKHPEWHYTEKTDWKSDMIVVPKVKLGGHEVGPVIFSWRPDEAWSKWMIHSMDKVVKGAIGGSAFKYLKVTIDYNSELVKFETK